MLFTAKVFKDPKFLTGHSTNGRRVKIPLSIITDINMAHKVIVDNEFFNSFGNGRYPDVTDKLTEVCTKHQSYYWQFARLPFKRIVFESENQCFYVEEISEHSFKFLYIEANFGFVAPCFQIVTIKEDGTLSVQDKNAYVLDGERDVVFKGHKVDIVESFNITARTNILYVLELLLLLNTKNTVIQKYRPSNKELRNIPKPLVDKFVYHIIDVYRDKPVYLSMEEIEKGMNVSPEQSIQRRTHLVRGHFKQKKNGLFWWSSFLRCRKNVSKGFVISDHRVKEPLLLES